MKILKLAKKNYIDWDSFVLDHPDATFFHTLKWMQILRKYEFEKPFYLLLYDQSDIIGVLPLYFVNVFPVGRGLTSLLDCNGLLIEDIKIYNKYFLLEMLRTLENIIKKYGLTFFKLRLQSPSPLNQFMPNYYVKHREYCTFLLDLSKGTEHIFKCELHKKTRNAIRKAIKLGVEIDKRCPKVETYWMLYREIQHKRNILC